MSLVMLPSQQVPLPELSTPQKAAPLDESVAFVTANCTR